MSPNERSAVVSKEEVVRIVLQNFKNGMAADQDCGQRDYEHVLGIYELNPMLKVKLDILCQHHLTTYLYILSLQTGRTFFRWTKAVPSRCPNMRKTCTLSVGMVAKL